MLHRSMTDKEMGIEAPAPKSASAAPGSQGSVMSPGDVKKYQASSAKKLFRQMDKNSDGQLSHKEIKNYLRANDAAKRLLVRPGDKWSDLWKKIERDPTNHLIDEAGFVAYLQSIQAL